MTAADAAPPSAEPSRSFEIERKYDAEDGTPLPDWSVVDVIATVGAAEIRELDARYYDTDDFALARAGFAVRRRSGGPDAGWHIKGPHVGGGRVELGWPLGVENEPIPTAVRAEITTVTDAALRPIARIRNTRTAYALCAADGSIVAEFVDDRVSATDDRTQTVRTWREWEIELAPAGAGDAESFFAQIAAAVLAAGGRAAASASKLARALGH